MEWVVCLAGSGNRAIYLRFQAAHFAFLLAFCSEEVHSPLQSFAFNVAFCWIRGRSDLLPRHLLAFYLHSSLLNEKAGLLPRSL